MNDVNRRDFLIGTGIGGVSLLGAGNAWSLSSLAPLGDTRGTEYPYRGWEDIYRKEYEHEVSGFAAHCVNCLGNCAFKILTRDGIVVREEQLAHYPQTVDGVPDTNPRGCQKGSVHSQAMYDADRLRYPMKRAGERGEGKWQRISWDQATTEIADKILDIHEEYGPGNLLTHTGTGVASQGKFAAGYRFASLVGGIQCDATTNVGDLNSGAHLAYGDPNQGFTTDAWFECDYVMMTFFNPNVTRIPDAHFMWEAKYNGARIVSVSPDYNPSAIHSDLWVNINPGTDPFFFMSLVYTVLDEGLWDEEFVKEQTDLPLLVRDDNRKLLRQSDLENGGKEDIFYYWDTRTQRVVEASGSTGSEDKTLALGDDDPALEGEFEVDGIKVQPAFVHMRAEALRYAPEETQEITGIHADVVRGEARLIAKAKKLCLADGFAVGKVLNGIYVTWAQALLCSLTAHAGERGGIDTSYNDDGYPAALRMISFDFTKFPLFEAGALGEFVRGEKMLDARAHYDNDKLKERVGFNLDELQDMIDEAIDTGQMPYNGSVKGAIMNADNMFTRAKGPHYRERMLEQLSELIVNINIRMDSTAMWADYVLPAASQYESWDIRKTPAHRHVNVFTASVKPVGESIEDWEIFVLLSRKIQERAIARNIDAFEHFGVTRDYKTALDDYTMGGTLMTAKEQVRWMVENSPEFGGVSFEDLVKKGFLTVEESPWPASSYVTKNKTIKPFEKQVKEKIPYTTLTGRATFYCDHEWFRKLGSTTPTAKLNAGKGASPYPYTFYTPHTRWGIHSTWRSNKYMQRLQRGEPFVYISPQLATEKGIVDGSQVRVFNGIGEFFAQAKIFPGIRDDQVMMEHAWERHQFRGTEGQKGLNNIVATLIQPLEMVGNWGHLVFKVFKWNPNQLANESGVDIERADDWSTANG